MNFHQSYRRISHSSQSVAILAYPPPYQAWFTISNDPDHTSYDRWQQLHQLIWEELQLPLADSFFITNYNQLSEQASLKANPDMAQAHAYDTMHTWGDYMFAQEKNFTRDDAEAGKALLKEQNISPLIWTDHAKFAGNMRHNNILGSVKTIRDTAGYEYANQYYSLDYVYDIGVRYVWDGELTPIVGQDRILNKKDWYRYYSESERAAKIGHFSTDVLGNFCDAWDANV